MKKINYKVVIKNQKITIKKNQRKSKYKPIPLILTFGKLYHTFCRQNKLTIYYTFYPNEKGICKMKLIYAISSKKSSLKNLKIAINEFYNDGIKHNVDYFETLIVNPKLKEVLIRENWEYVKKSWFIGSYYIKKNIK